MFNTTWKMMFPNRTLLAILVISIVITIVLLTKGNSDDKRTTKQAAVIIQQAEQVLKHGVGVEVTTTDPSSSSSSPPPKKSTSNTVESPPQKEETSTSGNENEKNGLSSSTAVTNPQQLDVWVGDEDPCCQIIQKASVALLGVPSDIQLLLPILGAYQRESDHETVVELGSRLGSSTMTMLRMMNYAPSKKRFATCDLEIRQPVEAMYKCMKKCSKGKFPKRNFFTVQGNDLSIPIPFVDTEKAASSSKKIYRPIDMLFIDTLHNGALLFMELQRYPQYVRKHIVFHDSYSFRVRNEGPGNYLPANWPESKPKPMGLQPVIREFLLEHPEWVEEMNNVHNNGFYVLRRRSVPVDQWISNEKVPRFTGFKMEPYDKIDELFNKKKKLSHKPVDSCNQAYTDMYRELGMKLERISPPCHIAPFQRHSYATDLYLLLLSTKDSELPLAPMLGVLASQFLAPLHLLGSNPRVFLWGCEASVVNAAMQGASQTNNPHVKFFITGKVKNSGGSAGEKVGDHFEATEESDDFCENNGKLARSYIEGHGQRVLKQLPLHMKGDAEKPPIDVLVISAQILSELSREQLVALAGSVRHRIVSYGTSLYSVANAHEVFTVADEKRKSAEQNDASSKEMLSKSDYFELKIGLNENVGVAMWEKKSSLALNYVPEAKKKHMHLI